MRRLAMVFASFSYTRSCAFIQFKMKLQFVLCAMLMITASAAAQPTKMMVTDAFTAASSGKIILVDIRTPDEWTETGIGDWAIALDMTQKTFVQSLLKLRKTYPDKQIAFICATGGRSAYLNRFLWQNGFKNTADVIEGMMGSRAGPGWLKTGLPVYPGVEAQIAARLKSVLP